MSEELKKNLQTVSEQLQQLNATTATIQKLIAGESVRIVESNPEEGKDPSMLTVTSSEMITAILHPVSNEVKARKERMLNMKESLLQSLEQELIPVAKETKDAIAEKEIKKNE